MKRQQNACKNLKLLQSKYMGHWLGGNQKPNTWIVQNDKRGEKTEQPISQPTNNKLPADHKGAQWAQRYN